MFYDLSILADRLAAALKEAEANLRLEQAVYGLDSRDELALHTLLADALACDYCVAREVHYPSTAGRKLSHRNRCDLVLSPLGRPLLLDSRPPTLFDPPDQCSPAEAFWLEVKVAYQYREGGERHGGYGAQWRDAIIADLRKMDADPLIRQAGLLLLVFNESEQILQKDIENFDFLLAQKEVLAGERQMRSVSILDRLGHRLCTAALWAIVQR